jgi:hypothetical protein
MDNHKDTRFALLFISACHVPAAAGAAGTWNSPKAMCQQRGMMKWNMKPAQMKARLALVDNRRFWAGFACWLKATRIKLKATTTYLTCRSRVVAPSLHVQHPVQ